MTLRASTLILIAAAGLAVSGCAQSRLQVIPDLGVRMNSALVAQIAGSDAAYPQEPPLADGSRVGLAQGRYRTGTVIAPVVTNTTNTVRSTAASPASPR